MVFYWLHGYRFDIQHYVKFIFGVRVFCIDEGPDPSTERAFRLSIAYVTVGHPGSSCALLVLDMQARTVQTAKQSLVIRKAAS